MAPVAAEGLAGHPLVLRALDSIEAAVAPVMVVFGSVARADERTDSDIDVLVVTDSERRVDSIRERIEAAEIGAMPLVHTEASLRQEAELKPSFVLHLLVEGAAVRGEASWAKLRAELLPVASDRSRIVEEIGRRLTALDQFRHVDRFRSSPITARAHLYAIARSVVIARLAAEGVHEFRWTHAFDRLSELHPELSAAIGSLADLRPFYEYARDRSDQPPASGDVGLEQLVRALDQVGRFG